MKYLVHCEQPNCYMHMTVNSEEEQTYYLANHKCPYWGGESKVSWSVTKTLVSQMWEKLDEVMDQIKTEMDTASMIRETELKARGRAIAECIAIFMTPFFESADDIAKEAKRRHKARIEGDSEYETPGIGHRRYESAALEHLSATPGWYGTVNDGYSADPAMAGTPSRRRGARAASAPRGTSTPPPVSVSEDDKEAMIMAHKGMPQIFTAAVLAKQYNYPEAVVSELLKA